MQQRRQTKVVHPPVGPSNAELLEATECRQSTRAFAPAEKEGEGFGTHHAPTDNELTCRNTAGGKTPFLHCAEIV
jgi:hypothetical protein